MSTLRLSALTMMLASAKAFFWVMPPRYEASTSYYEFADEVRRACTSQRARAHDVPLTFFARKHTRTRIPQSPLTFLSMSAQPPQSRWFANQDFYEYKLALPSLEPDSVTAHLSADGAKVEVSGRRKITSCECQPSTVREIALPYRPRAEDVSISIDKDVLSLRLARHSATADAPAPTPLTIKVEDRPKAAVEAQEPAGTRPLRFVPHASAQEGAATDDKAADAGVEAQESNLTDKFRAAARAALAVQHGGAEPTSAKEAAAATAEAESPA